MRALLERISLERIFQYTPLLLAALLPILVIPGLSFVQVSQTKMLLGAIFIAVALISWVAVSLLRKVVRAPRDVLLVCGAALPIAYFVSALATGWSASSFVGSGIEQDTVAAAILWYGALLFSAVAFSERRHLTRLFLLSVTVAGALALALFLLRLLFPSVSVFSLWGALSGPSGNVFGSWHDLNMLAGLVVFAGLAYAFEATASKALRVFGGVAALLGASILILGRFPDVLIVFGLLMAAYALFLFFEKEGTKKYIAVCLCIAACALGAFFASSWIGSKLPASLVVSELEVRPSWQGTFAVGQRLFAGEGSLIFGAGPNTFAEEWGKYKPADINTTLFWGADFTSGVGSVPTALVTTGALGIFAWLLLAGGFLFSVFTLFRYRGMDVGTRRHAGVFAFLAAYAVVFHIVYVPGAAATLLTFLLLGAFVAERTHARRGEPMSFRADFGTYGELLRSIAVVLIGCILFIAALESTRSLLSNIFVNKAVAVYAETSSVADAENALSKAFFFYGDNDRAHRAAVELGIITLQTIAASGAADETTRARLQSELGATVTHGLSAVAIDEKNYQNWLTLAQLYQNLAGAGVEGAYEAGRQAFERARTENPTNPISSLRLAQLEVLVGNIEAASVFLDEALQKKPDFAEAHFLRSQLLAQGGNFEEAENSAIAAARFAPQDPLAWYNVGAILYAQGAYAEAIPPLLQAVLLRADYANALFILALSYERSGNPSAAQELLERVLELNPGNQEVIQLLASLKEAASE